MQKVILPIEYKKIQNFGLIEIILFEIFNCEVFSDDYIRENWINEDSGCVEYNGEYYFPINANASTFDPNDTKNWFLLENNYWYVIDNKGGYQKFNYLQDAFLTILAQNVSKEFEEPLNICFEEIDSKDRHPLFLAIDDYIKKPYLW